MDELSIYRQWFEHITEKNEIVVMWSEIGILQLSIRRFQVGFSFLFLLSHVHVYIKQ